LVNTPSDDALNDLLARAIQLIGGFDSDAASGVENLKALEKRLEDEHFNLAVLGQFKRGKSTLLNSLLGEPILPSSVVPLTAIPTFVQWGPDLKARILFEDSQPEEEFTADDPESLAFFLEGFVTEESNPQNRQGVRQAEVYHPSTLLRRGLILIDTPGIGSTFQHNTETTLNFLPQCDAALFLISADPPVTEVEIEFLREVRTKVDHLFFIFNKMDYLKVDDRQRALQFFRKVLKDQAQIPETVPVYLMSALHALEARMSDDEDLLRDSGLEEVQDHLIDFLMNEKAQVLQDALARKAGDTVTETLMLANLTARSLQIPLESLEERVGLLDAKIREAERQRQSSGDLLTGDRKRTLEFLEEQARELRLKAQAYFEGIVRESTARTSDGEHMERAAKEAVTTTIPGFFERELGDMSLEFDRYVTRVLKPHQESADQLIDAVRRGAAKLFDIPYHAPESAGVLESSREPYWVTHKWGSTMNSIPAGLFDWVLPQGIKRSVILKRLLKQVEDLVIHNVENLRWATLQNLDAAFRGFTSDLDRRLEETISATHGAIGAVVARKKEHSETIAEELDKLETWISGLQEVENGFRNFIASRSPLKSPG
jgi:predicted GTPase